MTDRTDARLTELEIKASFADDLLEQLNQLVTRQQQQIDALQRELLSLRQQVRDGQDPDFGLGAVDERPPHY
jgi:SlyX protein